MKRIFKKLAKKDKAKKTTVENEITLAIKAGMNDSTPAVQASWKNLFPNGKEPSPEEFITKLASEVLKRSIINSN